MTVLLSVLTEVFMKKKDYFWQFSFPILVSLQFSFVTCSHPTSVFWILINSFTPRFLSKYICKRASGFENQDFRKKGMLTSKGLVFQAFVKEAFWNREPYRCSVYHTGMSWCEAGSALTYFFLLWPLWKIPSLWSKDTTQVLGIAFSCLLFIFQWCWWW